MGEYLGMTQVELSQKAGGVRIGTLSDYENGRVQRHDLVILERLAIALGVEPGFLFVREPQSRRKWKGE